jgi:hypothetical protein
VAPNIFRTKFPLLFWRLLLNLGLPLTTVLWAGFSDLTFRSLLFEFATAGIGSSLIATVLFRLIGLTRLGSQNDRPE